MTKDTSSRENCRIAIIGSGPTGIAMGRALLLQGFKKVSILEKNAAAGGTWHQHSYPGLACDVWAHSYSYSYALNPDWSSNYVERAEIEAYLQKCARDFGVEKLTRFETRVDSAHYQGNGEWLLTLNGDQTEYFDVVINAGGNQHTPQMPAIAGIDSFQGDSWHSTHWDSSVELKGKRVAVVGSAAAALQIVPEIVGDVEKLYVVQRRPNWVMGRGKKPYSNFQKWVFKTLPASLKAVRATQAFFMGLMYQAATMGHKRMKDFEGMASKYLESKVSDQKMREELLPKTNYGCQRGLVSDGYYEALQRSNTELISSAAAEVNAGGLLTADGRQLDVDVIVYCTGYKVLDFDRIEVLGENQTSLAETMKEAPEAFKGMAVPDFPNFFFAIGPNGLLLSASYFVTVEISTNTLARLLADKADKGVQAMAVKPEEYTSFNEWARSRYANFSWGHSSCDSYYRTPGGHSPFLYPGSIKEYKKMKDSSGLHEYICS